MIRCSSYRIVTDSAYTGCSLKVDVFWDVTLCVDGWVVSEASWCIHLQDEVQIAYLYWFTVEIKAPRF